VRAERPLPNPLPDPGAERVWVRAEGGPPKRLRLGIERYYFNEKRAEEMNALRGGAFYARVVVAKDGTLKLLSLEKP
jgi:uncharacterized membrane-anchored protein